MSEFTAIIPPIIQTQLTGFIGAGERTIRGVVWRVEWYFDRPAVFKRNGIEIGRADAGNHAGAMALHKDSFELFADQMGRVAV
ncbi:MAG: hypothetical protein V4527_18955 [Pseudomonadota bacterium]